jgi:AcrR family transcriptional regulator
VNVRRGRKPDPQRRQEVLDAVVDHLLEHGLSDLSLRPLAAAVGGTPKLLMHHFGSKEQLLIEAIRAVDERRAALYEAWLAEGVAPQDVVLRGWQLQSTAQALSYERFRLHVLAWALDNPDRYGEFLVSYNTASLDLIEAGLEIDGVVDPEDRRRVATVVRAVLRGLYLDLMASGDGARVEAAGFHYFAEQLRAWMDEMKARGRMKTSRAPNTTGK